MRAKSQTIKAKTNYVLNGSDACIKYNLSSRALGMVLGRVRARTKLVTMHTPRISEFDWLRYCCIQDTLSSRARLA